MRKKTICFVAGGTGGHILPAIVLAKKWHEANQGRVIFITSFVALEKDLDKELLDKQPFIERYFRSNIIKPPGKRFWLYPKFSLQFLWKFIQTLYLFMHYKPDRIVSTGGYISVPVILAGKFLGVSSDLYDVNAVPGKAAVFLSRFVNNIYVTYSDCVKYFNGAQVVSYPVRFSEGDLNYNKEDITKNLGLDSSRKTLFLLGGSQGSVFLNDLLKKWLSENKGLLGKIQIIHQTGSFDPSDWSAFYKNLNVPHITFNYCDDIKKYYQAADLVISRAGAGAMFELAFFKKRCLVIPHAVSYTSHQKDNARLMASENPEAFQIIDQSDIEEVSQFLNDFIKD